MNLMLSTVIEEKKRIEYMLEKYRCELDKFPKGSISQKRVRDNTYYYLKHREGKKIISKYISKSEINEVYHQIEHRKHIEIMIMSLKEELEIAQKVLEEYL